MATKRKAKKAAPRKRALTHDPMGRKLIPIYVTKYGRKRKLSAAHKKKISAALRKHHAEKRKASGKRPLGYKHNRKTMRKIAKTIRGIKATVKRRKIKEQKKRYSRHNFPRK
jgi:hypothetical protein